MDFLEFRDIKKRFRKNDVLKGVTFNIKKDAADINTTDKYEGKIVFNSTTNIPVWAAGSAAGDLWVDATGATAHTPV